MDLCAIQGLSRPIKLNMMGMNLFPASHRFSRPLMDFAFMIFPA